MTNLQLIEALCKIVEEETVLIKKLYSRLAEIGEVSADEESAFVSIEAQYVAVLGHDEVPDFLSD